MYAWRIEIVELGDRCESLVVLVLSYENLGVNVMETSITSGLSPNR